MLSRSNLDATYEYSKTGNNLRPNSLSPFKALIPSTLHGENIISNYDRRFGKCASSLKRQRDHHVILASSQDDDDSDDSDDHGEHSMMDCDQDATRPNKRRCFAYDAFPFDNDGKIIQQHGEQINPIANESTVLEECTGMNISIEDEGSSPVEWWRKKRPSVISASAVAAPIAAKSIVEHDALHSGSAMDTSVGDEEICCHICQNSFPIPISPSVREVMPENALLNYFSPLNKKPTSNGFPLATHISHSAARAASKQIWANSPACCPCCDRPSCPKCRQECQGCQKSFCSFCSITCDDDMTNCGTSNSNFCLDCYDRLR